MTQALDSLAMTAGAPAPLAAARLPVMMMQIITPTSEAGRTRAS
jgi:hypothetical protein